MIDVYNFCSLLTDDGAQVRIYDMHPAIENEVFIGTAEDTIGCAWSAYEVLSFDLCGGNIHHGYTPYIVLNIDTSVK